MRKKRFKLGLILLATILVVPLFVKGIRGLQNSVYDGSHHINIVIDNGDLEVWSIEPKEKSISRITISQNTYLSIPSYGAYKASSIGKFSLLEKKDTSLVKEAIENTLAVPVDGVVISEEGKVDPLDLERFFGIRGFIEAIVYRPFNGRVTNLTSFDWVRLWFLSFSIRKEAIEKIDLSGISAVSAFTLPDQTEGILVDTDRFSSIALRYFKDKSIEEEHVSIEVVNGTKEQGKANAFALILTNIGGNVINTVKGEESMQTVVYSKTRNYTASKIASIVQAKLIIESPKDSRSDIQVLLGEKR